MKIYGPVPSRRFGLSLGVDLLPHKTCPFDCLYCQLGVTDCLTATTDAFFSIDDVLADVEEALADGPDPDVITFAGSGEPTLYRPLDELIDGLRELSDIPLLLITNSALLWQQEVARAVHKMDILAPSLDAGDQAMFERVNRPHPEITFEKMVRGLREITGSFSGEIRLEVMLIRDVNDDEKSMRAIADVVETIRADQIDLNTPVRPAMPERGALPCSEEVLDRALEIFGPRARSIGVFDKRTRPAGKPHRFTDGDKDIREMLLRRPCTLAEIVASLGRSPAEVEQSLERLMQAGFIAVRSGQDGTYYHAPTANPTLLR